MISIESLTFLFGALRGLRDNQLFCSQVEAWGRSRKARSSKFSGPFQPYPIWDHAAVGWSRSRTLNFLLSCSSSSLTEIGQFPFFICQFNSSLVSCVNKRLAAQQPW